MTTLAKLHDLLSRYDTTARYSDAPGVTRDMDQLWDSIEAMAKDLEGGSELIGTFCQHWIGAGPVPERPPNLVWHGRLAFEPDEHRYYLDGQRPLRGVSDIVEQMFPAFDAERVSQLCAGKGDYVGMGPEQVRAQWAREGEETARLGGQWHGAIETFLETGSRTACPEFLSWWTWWVEGGQDLVGEPRMVEEMVYDEQLGMAGTIDFFGAKLVDWKRKKRFRTSYRGQKGLGPCVALPACDAGKIGLQLTLYGHMLRLRGEDPGDEALVVHLTPGEVPTIEVHTIELQYDLVPRVFAWLEEMEVLSWQIQ